MTAVRHPVGETIANKDGVVLLEPAVEGRGSLMPAFAKAYYEQSGRKACYAHCAKGATTVCQWQPGTERYEALVKKARGAIACLEREDYTVGHRSFVWLQGESDAIENTPPGEYIEKMKALADKLQEDLSIEYFMIIRVGKFYDFPCEVIMEAQEQLCREDERFYMLTRVTSTFTVENGLMQDGDWAFHYTNKGYDLVGDIAGRNAAKYIQGEAVELEPEAG